MIRQDTTQLYDHDCSTCAHRVERHPSRHSDQSKPRSLNYVCLVCARAIGEHGCWMQTRFKGGQGFHAHELGEPRWVQEVPCRKYDKKLDKGVPIDYEPMEARHADGQKALPEELGGDSVQG